MNACSFVNDLQDRLTALTLSKSMSVAALGIFKLPVEIRIHILDYATRTSEWAPHMFFPPENDFKYVEGFTNALPIFRRWVEEAQTLLLQLSVAVDGVKGILASKIPAKYVRHLRVQGDLKKAPIELVRFKKLESLSITQGEDNFDCAFRYESQEMAGSLRRLDFAWRGDVEYLTSRLYVFPNLVEVRFAVSQPTIRKTNIKNFIMESQLDFDNQEKADAFILRLTKVFRGCQRLQLLSLHMTVTPRQVYHEVCRRHKDEHEHMSCDYRDCSLCGTAALDEKAKEKERYMTRKLAQNLLALKCVRWSVAFRGKGYFDEVGQREYVISRWDDGSLDIGGERIIEES